MGTLCSCWWHLPWAMMLLVSDRVLPANCHLVSDPSCHSHCFHLKAAILTFVPWPMDRRMCSHRPGGSPRGIPTTHAVTAPVVFPLLVPPLGAELCRSLPSSALRSLNVISHLFSFLLVRLGDRFSCAHSWLWHVGSCSLTRDQTQTPCIGSLES